MEALYFLAWPAVSGLFLFSLRRHATWAQYANLVFQIVWAYFLYEVINRFNLAQLESPSQPLPILMSWHWLPFLKSKFALGVDGLSLPLIILNVLLSVCLAFYSIGRKNLGGNYFALFSLLNAASVGSLMAADIFTFYCFWEFMLIPLSLIIGIWGSGNRIYAALKFFAFTMVGSLFLLAAILYLSSDSTVASLGWHDLVAADFSSAGGWKSVQGLLFLGFLLAFAVKIPVWPVHTWLPDAHTEAPTGASVILAGVLLKLGVYGIARWCLPIFPEASAAAAPILMILGLTGIVMGAFAAWWQTDIKKTIAYSSVSHLGFMVLGVFALREEGLQGAMFQNLAHGVSTGALFLIFGIIYERTHSRKIEEYGGMASINPAVAVLFMVASMASVALPGLPGFVGEFLILSGTFIKAPLIALGALSGVVLGAVYTLKLVKRVLFGPTTELVTTHPVKLTWNEWAAISPLTIALVILGFGAMPVLKLAQSAVTQMLVNLR